MKKIILMVFMAIMLPASNLFALTATVEFNGSLGGGAEETAIENNIKSQLETDLAKYDSTPDFARGMANSSVYSSSAGTTRGYQGYDLFTVSLGTMVSVQMPDSGTDYGAIADELEDEGDVYAGVGWQPVAGQLGINLGFLVEDLYMAFKFGKFRTEWIDYELGMGDDKVTYDASLFGVMFNYSVIKEKSILARTLLWRGVSIGAGFTYSYSKINYGLSLDEFTDTGNVGIYTLDYSVDPSIELQVESKNYIIPIEVYTSIRLLYAINLGIGAGFDYVAGSDTKVDVRADGVATITDDGAGGASGYVGETGDITVTDAGAEEEADKFRAKLMANVGFSVGPVFIDVPVTYYIDNAYSVGITAGFVW